MLIIQDLLSLLQVDRLCLRCLPGKRSHEVQIVIERSVFRAVLALLLHAIQHLLGFAAGFVVHIALADLLLEALHIADILRMHLIELILQVVDLLADRSFPIRLLIVFFGCGICLG